MDETNDLKGANQNKFLTFMLDGGIYGIHIGFIKEIVGLQPINNVPDIPDYVKGVINLRGNIIPVVDTGLLLCKKELRYGERACIIIIDFEDKTFGILTEQISEVADTDDILPPPSFKETSKNQFVSGIGKADNCLIVLLNCKALSLK